MNKISFLFLIIIFSFSFELNAQKGEEVLDFVEEEATFPGGSPALMRFLKTHLNYPIDCVDKGIEGKVFVSFVIETNGKISNITVEKGTHPSLNKEAMRVVAMMPKWKPAKFNGKKVRARCRLPVNFTLT